MTEAQYEIAVYVLGALALLLTVAMSAWWALVEFLPCLWCAGTGDQREVEQFDVRVFRCRVCKGLGFQLRGRR